MPQSLGVTHSGIPQVKVDILLSREYRKQKGKAYTVNSAVKRLDSELFLNTLLRISTTLFPSTSALISFKLLMSRHIEPIGTYSPNISLFFYSLAN